MANTVDERSYGLGSRTAWVRVLRQALYNLGYDDPEAQGARWILEREATVAQLRGTCAAFGDNDWPSNLHLADVVYKHLARHLHKRAPVCADTGVTEPVPGN